MLIAGLGKVVARHWWHQSWRARAERQEWCKSSQGREAATMGPAGTEALPNFHSLPTLCPMPSQTKSNRYKRGGKFHSVLQTEKCLWDYHSLSGASHFITLGQYKIQNNRFGRDLGSILVQTFAQAGDTITLYHSEQMAIQFHLKNLQSTRNFWRSAIPLITFHCSHCQDISPQF